MDVSYYITSLILEDRFIILSDAGKRSLPLALDIIINRKKKSNNGNKKSAQESS